MVSYSKWTLWVIVGSAIFTASCASTPKEEAAQQSSLGEIRELLNKLNSKVDRLEIRLDGKTAATSSVATAPAPAPSPGGIDAPPVSAAKAAPVAHKTGPELQGVSSHPAEGVGISTRSALVTRQNGFTEDEAVQAFRQAMILQKAQKQSQAILAFSNFLERFPDHPLAGTAQYRIGEAYFLQKEYKLALHELQRVLTSYDRSAHVADTLRLMALSEDALKLPEAAVRHRQLLSSLFAQSPAASASSPALPTASAEHFEEPPPTAPLSKSISAPVTAPATPPLDRPAPPAKELGTNE